MDYQGFADFLKDKFGDELLTRWVDEAQRETTEETGLKEGARFYHTCFMEVLAERIGSEMAGLGFPNTSDDLDDYCYKLGEIGEVIDYLVAEGFYKLSFLELAHSIWAEYGTELISTHSVSSEIA